MAYEIVPGASIGPVRLGMTRDEARAGFDHEPTTFDRGGPVDGFHDAALQVGSEGGRVNFVEVARDDAVPVTLLGFDPFAVERDECVARVAAELGDPEVLENGTTFRFERLGLSPWDGGDDSGRFTSVAVFAQSR